MNRTDGCSKGAGAYPEGGQSRRGGGQNGKAYVVVTVPSKPDDNPEHIHLLTKEKLTQLFNAVGCTKLHFDGVEGHLFMVAGV